MDPPASRLTDEEDAYVAPDSGPATMSDDIITIQHDPQTPAFKDQIGSTIRSSTNDEPPLVHAAAVEVPAKEGSSVVGRFRRPPRRRKPKGLIAEGSLVASDITDTLEWPSSIVACNQRCLFIILLGITLGCVMTVGVLLGVLCGTTNQCGARSVGEESLGNQAPTAGAASPSPAMPSVLVIDDDFIIGISTPLPSPTTSPTSLSPRPMATSTEVPTQVPTTSSVSTPDTVSPTVRPTQKPTAVAPTALPTTELARSAIVRDIANFIVDESWLDEPLRFSIDGDVIVDDMSPEERALHWILHQDSVLGTSPITTTAKETLLQRYALLTLWFQQAELDPQMPQGLESSWTSSVGWATEASVCDWDHVVCDASGRVAQVQMEAIEFTGTIPPDLALLSHLRRLNLEDNPNLTGTIPDSLGQGLHEKLVFLDLGPNRLSGTLPSTLGLLTALTFFSVNRCPGIVGTIPAELSHWTNLRRAGLFGTNLVGPMPLCDIVPLPPNLDLTADCDAVDCPCCMFCCPGARNGIPAFVAEPCE